MRALMLTLLVVLGVQAGEAAAAQRMAVAALPGGTVIYKQVQSIRERRFANLVQQKTDFSCGAAALATVLKQAYWLDVDEPHIIEGMLANSDHDQVRVQGFSMLDMKRYVESIGMRARGYRIPPESLQSVTIPVVVLMDIRGYKHFVVLQRTEKDWVYVGDPVLGNKRYKFDDFVKGWNGIIFAVIGPGYDKANALLSTPGPLTAKHQLNSFKPIDDAQLMEFGFIQSDFF